MSFSPQVFIKFIQFGSCWVTLQDKYCSIDVLEQKSNDFWRNFLCANTGSVSGEMFSFQLAELLQHTVVVHNQLVHPISWIYLQQHQERKLEVGFQQCFSYPSKAADLPWKTSGQVLSVNSEKQQPDR